MPKRKYNTNPEQLLAEGQLIVSTTSDAKYQHKVELVNLVLSGLTPSFLSKYVAESKGTITKWVKIADEQGFESLRTKKQTGRPPKLNAKQLQEIKEVLEKDAPKDYGFNVWDGPNLSAFIKKTYKISLSIRQCQRLFHDFGFSLVRPQTFPSKNEDNKTEREAFKKT